jgi:hypothetical protein
MELLPGVLSPILASSSYPRAEEVVYLLEEAAELRYLVAAEEQPSLQVEGEVGSVGVESVQVEDVKEIPQSLSPLFHPS